MVNFFITDDRKWDVGMLDSFFIPGDSANIQNIMLTRLAHVDNIFWFCNDRGIYSVRSRYRLACNLEFGDSAGSSSGTDFWEKAICKLGLPKIKHFLWKGASRALPHCLNLNQRAVGVVLVPALGG